MDIETLENGITIRPATEQDAPAFRELRLEALRTHPEVFSADYASAFDQPIAEWQDRLRSNDGIDSIVYLATVENELVGMTGIARASSLKTRHNARIWGVYVRPDQRGRGVGMQLIRHCLAWASRQNVELVKLGVVSTNLAAIRCYSSCGFHVYGVEPKAILHNNVYYDELLMARETLLSESGLGFEPALSG